MDITTKHVTLTELTATEGHVLTQSATDTPLTERVLTDRLILAVGVSPDEWTEITEAEAEQYRAQMEAARQAEQQPQTPQPQEGAPA